jgi:hypothetical protein
MDIVSFSNLEEKYNKCWQSFRKLISSSLFHPTLFSHAFNPARIIRRPVFGAGSWGEGMQHASLASYEAFTSLLFLTDGLGRRIESRKLDKYIINGNERLKQPCIRHASDSQSVHDDDAF